MTRPRLFVAGAAHVDRRGRVSGAYAPAASNPGTMREEVGGGAFNALRNAARHGVATSILSLRGGDMAGETVARAIAATGSEDLSAVFLDRTTPSYTALLDSDGELIAGFADMGLYEAGFERQMRRRRIRVALEGADAVLCDANMPAAAIERLCRLAGQRPVFAIAISPAKAPRLAASLPSLSGLFMNLREARALTGLGDARPNEAASALRAMGLRRGAISDGGAAVTCLDGEAVFAVQPPAAHGVADVTGAGDALAGVTVACLMRGMGFAEALRRGVAAAVLTVETPAVVADYPDARFADALALVGEPLPVA